MTYWEITKERAQTTLSIWKSHAPEMKVGGVSAGELEEMIGQFEPLVQAQVLAQYELNAQRHAEKNLKTRIKELNLRVPRLIEVELPEHEELMAGVRELTRIPSQTREKILTRGRATLPVWEMANAALAALPEPLPPVTCRLQGVEHTAEMLAGLLQEFNEQARQMGLARTEMARAKTALRALDRRAGKLNKNWYKAAAHTFENGTPAREALERVPVLRGARMPTILCINSLKQGGQEGRQVLVDYVPRGGETATRLLLHWGVEGVDEGLPHSMPLNRAGDALGPFPVGTVVRARVEAANSAGARFCGVESLEILDPNSDRRPPKVTRQGRPRGRVY
ncbi:MAG TPA: hypothetical protein DIT64_08650 [Verrucomicrobiales bacterium]|nr:hypothetical protein [Verrucomicrobiales bacterium]